MDMTAMSDVAWLLLTFFILTTQFRTPEIIEVATPKSIAESKLQDGKVMRITITEDGRNLFNIFDENKRVQVLEEMGKRYGISFTDAEKNNFKETADFGVPMNEMKTFLNKSAREREDYVKSIPLDSINNQLVDWVTRMHAVDGEVVLAIRSDRDTKYPEFKELIDALQKQNINKFQLVTSIKKTSDNE